MNKAVIVLGLGVLYLSLPGGMQSPAAEHSPAYRVGLARKCITPEEPLWLAGYMGRRHPSEGRESVIAVVGDYEDRPANRITMTPMVINTARCIFIIVKGGQKADIVASVLGRHQDEVCWPIQRIKPTEGEVIWLLDKEAAASL